MTGAVTDHLLHGRPEDWRPEPWRPEPWRLETAEQVERLGADIARLLQVGDLVCLWGPLGAGKSTLARGLIRALTSPDEEVPSPTFTLVQTYDTPRLAITHLDLYRLKSPEEALELGIEAALDEGAALIEWPERLEGDLPSSRLDLELRHPADGSVGREVRLAGRGSWAERARELGRTRDF